ncbi:MAG: hypothetical protein NTV82_03255 [Candidatus Aminicenantes bacterium]|nr:hypothetical protein [Candidatus Aminicenantes bacterium]
MPEILDFLTPTTLKVLEFFFANSRIEYHEREIVRKAKISKGSANKILRRLAELALLTRVQKGRMVFSFSEVAPRGRTSAKATSTFSFLRKRRRP